MKSIHCLVLSFFILLASFCGAEETPDDYEGHYRFTIRETKYSLSDEFELEKEGVHFGRVLKNKIKIPGRTHYRLHDEDEQLEAVGITSFFKGIIWNWATQLDVYDHNGDVIGRISGEVFTTRTNFRFYDENDQLVGLAYLAEGAHMTEKGTGFTIKHPENEYYNMVMFDRIPMEGEIDPWEVHVYDELIDSRLLKVFSAFVVDRQGLFFEDF